MCSLAAPVYARLADETDEVSATLVAMDTAASRFATALRANDSAEVALQAATAAILAGELADSLSAQQQAQVKLVDMLTSLGVATTITRTHLKGLVTSLRRLRHFPSGLARYLNGLTPAAVAGVFESELRSASGAGALQSQGAISAGSYSALAQALDGLAAATTTAATAQGLSEFDTAAQAVSGPAQPFLIASERALTVNP